MKIQEERVLLLMEENGITQRKMAQDLAISPTTLNGYLHGKYLHVPDDVIREIADYLQVSVDYITDRSALSASCLKIIMRIPAKHNPVY